MFRADNRYHTKNRQRRIDITKWNRELHEKLFAVMPTYGSGKVSTPLESIFLLDSSTSFILHLISIIFIMLDKIDN